MTISGMGRSRLAYSFRTCARRLKSCAALKGRRFNWRGLETLYLSLSFKTAFRKMRARAGLGMDVVPKTIRHTMATELRAAAVPLRGNAL